MLHLRRYLRYCRRSSLLWFHRRDTRMAMDSTNPPLRERRPARRGDHSPSRNSWCQDPRSSSCSHAQGDWTEEHPCPHRTRERKRQRPPQNRAHPFSPFARQGTRRPFLRSVDRLRMGYHRTYLSLPSSSYFSLTWRKLLKTVPLLVSYPSLLPKQPRLE